MTLKKTKKTKASPSEKKIKTSKNKKAETIAKLAAITADECKAEDTLILEMTDLSSFCDYFVICTGKSTPQLSAISEKISEAIKEKTGTKALTIEGEPASRWIVMDYGAVIVHILSPEMREYYQLENMWGDAPRMLEFLPPQQKKKSEK